MLYWTSTCSFLRMSWISSCIKYSLLLSEQQVPWEEAIAGQTVATMVGHQPDLVSLLKLNVRVATGCDVAALPCGEWVHNQLTVMHQIHTARVLADRTVELELVNAWVLTGKNSCLDVIAVLSVVEGLMKDDWHAGFGGVVAQPHREGNFLLSARGSKRASRTRWPSESWVKKDISTIILTEPSHLKESISVSIFTDNSTGSVRFTCWSWGSTWVLSYRTLKGKNQYFQNTPVLALIILGQLLQRGFQNINSPSSLHGLRSKEGMSSHWM